MKYRTTIGTIAKSRGSRSVEIKSQQIVVDLDEEAMALEHARANAEAIEAGIRAIPDRTRDGKRQLFVRTGHLASTITTRKGADGVEVIAPPGYLQDPAMLERLASVVSALRDPLGDKRVRDAIAATASAAVKVK